MSIEAIAKILDAPLGGTRKLILIGIANHARPDGTESFPAVSTLAAYACCGRRSVQYALRWLEDNGWIEGTGWHKWADKKQTRVYKLTGAKFARVQNSVLEGCNPLRPNRPIKPSICIYKGIALSNLPSEIPEALAKEIIDYRAHNAKSKLTQRAFDSLVAKFSDAQSHGFTPEAIVTKWQESGWRGFEWGWIEKARNLNGTNRKQAGVDRVIEANERRLRELGDLP